MEILSVALGKSVRSLWCKLFSNPDANLRWLNNWKRKDSFALAILLPKRSGFTSPRSLMTSKRLAVLALRSLLRPSHFFAFFLHKKNFLLTFATKNKIIIKTKYINHYETTTDFISYIARNYHNMGKRYNQ